MPTAHLLDPIFMALILFTLITGVLMVLMVYY